MSIKKPKINPKTILPINTNISNNSPLYSPEYTKILSALQSLYRDRDVLSDQIASLKDDLDTIKHLLIGTLQYQKELNDFETKLFRKNLAT